MKPVLLALRLGAPVIVILSPGLNVSAFTPMRERRPAPNHSAIHLVETPLASVLSISTNACGLR